MYFIKRTLAALGFLGLSVAPAMAATSTVETFSFDAQLTSGKLLCGAYVTLEVDCADQFGTIPGSAANDLMLGKTIGGSYRGEIALEIEDGAVQRATCTLGGADCMFDDSLLRLPAASRSGLDFSKSALVFSRFEFEGETGSYFFATDYESYDDGVRYYTGVEFDLTNVERQSIAVVPLMGSAGFLAFAIGGFAAFSRRKTSRQTS